VNNVRRETSRSFKNKNLEYLKENMNVLVTDSKSKISQTYLEE